jgi:hypothetical protein
MQKIALIDDIWVQQNAPVYAFEVETTKARESKVMAELSRPTFKKIGLSNCCHF